jgi:hypothetical protein
MWFLNVVLPVVIGSYFVLNFKTQLPASRRRNYIKNYNSNCFIPHNPHLLLGDTSTDLWFYQGEYNQSNGLTPNKILHYHSISG